MLVLGAVGLEVVAGMNANSPVPSWGHLVPLAWPPAARVAWWLVVAGAVVGFHVSLRRLGLGHGPLVVAASAVPFLAFAVGIAFGADWSTWH